jgi:hypothetical protein
MFTEASMSKPTPREHALDKAHDYALSLIEDDVPGEPRLTLLSAEGEDAGTYP